MPARTSSAPAANSMAEKNRKAWIANGCKPNDKIKQRPVKAVPTTSPADVLTPEQLGTTAAFAHPSVVAFGKYTAERKVAKRLIALYGARGYDAKLTTFDVKTFDTVVAQITEEFGNFPITVTGIRIAGDALKATYQGVPKPVVVETKPATTVAKAVTPTASRKTHKTTVRPSRRPSKRTVAFNGIDPTLASQMHRMAVAPVRRSLPIPVMDREEHLVLSEN